MKSPIFILLVNRIMQDDDIMVRPKRLHQPNWLVAAEKIRQNVHNLLSRGKYKESLVHSCPT